MPSAAGSFAGMMSGRRGAKHSIVLVCASTSHQADIAAAQQSAAYDRPTVVTPADTLHAANLSNGVLSHANFGNAHLLVLHGDWARRAVHDRHRRAARAAGHLLVPELGRLHRIDRQVLRRKQIWHREHCSDGQEALMASDRTEVRHANSMRMSGRMNVGRKSARIILTGLNQRRKESGPAFRLQSILAS